MENSDPITTSFPQRASTSDASAENVKLDFSRENLSPQECEEASNKLNRWRHIFSKWVTDLGCADLVEHESI